MTPERVVQLSSTVRVVYTPALKCVRLYNDNVTPSHVMDLSSRDTLPIPLEEFHRGPRPRTPYDVPWTGAMSTGIGVLILDSYAVDMQASSGILLVQSGTNKCVVYDINGVQVSEIYPGENILSINVYETRVHILTSSILHVFSAGGNHLYTVPTPPQAQQILECSSYCATLDSGSVDLPTESQIYAIHRNRLDSCKSVDDLDYASRNIYGTELCARLGDMYMSMGNDPMTAATQYAVDTPPLIAMDKLQAHPNAIIEYIRKYFEKHCTSSHTDTVLAFLHSNSEALCDIVLSTGLLWCDSNSVVLLQYVDECISKSAPDPQDEELLYYYTPPARPIFLRALLCIKLNRFTCAEECLQLLDIMGVQYQGLMEQLEEYPNMQEYIHRNDVPVVEIDPMSLLSDMKALVEYCTSHYTTVEMYTQLLSRLEEYPDAYLRVLRHLCEQPEYVITLPLVMEISPPSLLLQCVTVYETSQSKLRARATLLSTLALASATPVS